VLIFVGYLSQLNLFVHHNFLKVSSEVFIQRTSMWLFYHYIDDLFSVYVNLSLES